MKYRSKPRSRQERQLERQCIDDISEKDELVELHIKQMEYLQHLKSAILYAGSLPVLAAIGNTLERFFLWQSVYELFWMFDHLKRIRPTVIVEIGCYTGGTLDVWEQYSTLTGAGLRKIIGIDLDINRIIISAPLRPKTVLLNIDTSATEATHELDIALVGENIDFGFIDGSHRYENVKKDFDLLWPKIRPGGALAFHDIKWSAESVGRFWQTLIGEKYHTLEEYGVGIIYKPQ